ncbi:MAG: universal stress protein [Flammeovirgaceae bacterium]|nr:universal stress protein [Flammeovirgaceae bacterium]
MKKILVPFDFSKHAINAYRYACDICDISNGSIHLIHVVELPVMHDTLLMPVLSFEEALLKEMKEKADAQFKKITTKYKPDNDKVTTTTQFGPVSKIITGYVDDKSIDLVVMGSHGASGLREFFVGSNAEKIVRNSSAPVIVVKEYSKKPIKHIVFPNVLETENQETFVRKVKALQEFYKATLHIVWINTPTNFTRDIMTQKRLDAFIKRFMFKNTETHIFNDLDEETGIINFCNSIGGDMIAMGTHGRKGLAHFSLGSVAEDVVNHVAQPIWTSTLAV